MQATGKKSGRGYSGRVVPVIALSLVVLAGCMQAALVSSRTVDGEALGSLGAERFNAAHIKTGGGSDEEILHAFVLYRDDVAVRFPKPPGTLPRMTIPEALAAYQKAMYRSRVAVGSMTREFRVDGRVVAYAIQDIRMDVDLWRDGSPPESGRLILILNYADTRKEGDDASGLTH